MRGRVAAAAGLMGVMAVHESATPPSVSSLSIGAIGLLCLWFVSRRLGGRALPVGRMLRWVCVWGFSAWVGWAMAGVSAQGRLDQRLAPGNVDRVSRVTLRIVSLPRLQPDRVTFDAEVLRAHPAGVPELLRVTWAAPGWRGPYAAARPADPPFPEVRAGQVWRMALVLRPVRGAQNMHAFDYERHAFAHGIRALGTVRGTPEYLRDENWGSLAVMAGRARHAVREAMAPHLDGLRYGPVMRALAIGDQDGVEDRDWQVFNRTGLTHLVSISGSHITMLAGVGAWIVGWGWRRLPWRRRPLAERCPARLASAWAAMGVAWLYCLLAGWGVPAQRTFMMLATVALSWVLGLRLGGARILAVAAVVVVALDPWAILASGFWLSFGAVAVLLAVGARIQAHPSTGGESRWRRFAGHLKWAVHLQLAVTVALGPPLALLFHEFSLVSPLANAYGIPLIELVVTPLSLLLAAAALIPGLEAVAGWFAWGAHAVLYGLMQPTRWLADWPVLPVPAVPFWTYLLGTAGAAFALWPGRLPVPEWALRWRLPRVSAWLTMAPMVLWPLPHPDNGEWDLYALDVGQGSAILVKTARHVLLFDAGARHNRESDQGGRTIVPALRALGIRKLDAFVVSHADLDHAGGVRSVLDAVAVEQSFSSFDLPRWLHREARKLGAAAPRMPLAATRCAFGGRWRVDGVMFEFLWPLPSDEGEAEGFRARKADANARSCVLRIRGRYHSALLTGDVEEPSERALVQRGLTPADVVVAAHHGSRTSSSAPFVNAVQARHVIVQAGSWNRYGHPAPAVLDRWSASGARIWRTDLHGGVNALSLFQTVDESELAVIRLFRRPWGRIVDGWLQTEPSGPFAGVRRLHYHSWPGPR